MYYFETRKDTVNTSFFLLFSFLFVLLFLFFRKRSDGFPDTLGRQKWGSRPGDLSRGRSRRKDGRVGDMSLCWVLSGFPLLSSQPRSYITVVLPVYFNSEGHRGWKRGTPLQWTAEWHLSAGVWGSPAHVPGPSCACTVLQLGPPPSQCHPSQGL